MKRKVVRSEAAVEDLLGIVDDMLITFGLEAALAVDDRIDVASESPDELSSRGRIVPELRARGIVAYRETVALPYRIIYRLEHQGLWSVSVIAIRRYPDASRH